MRELGAATLDRGELGKLAELYDGHAAGDADAAPLVASVHLARPVAGAAERAVTLALPIGRSYVVEWRAAPADGAPDGRSSRARSSTTCRRGAAPPSRARRGAIRMAPREVMLGAGALAPGAWKGGRDRHAQGRAR